MDRLRHIAFSLVLFLQGLAAFGEDTEENPFADAKQGILGFFKPVVSLVETGMVLAAGFVLVAVVVKLMSGDRESAKKLAWWVVGLTVGFVLLAVLSAVSDGIVAAEQGITA